MQLISIYQNVQSVDKAKLTFCLLYMSKS